MTLDEYKVYKSILWLTVDTGRLPGIGDIVKKVGMPADVIKRMLKVLEDGGVVQSRPEGIKVIKDVMWCEKKNRPCYE